MPASVIPLPPDQTIVLGSRSPRRRELLQYLAPAEQIAVLPPIDGAEPGFADTVDGPAIERRLTEIALHKLDAVRERLTEPAAPASVACLLCADTVVVVDNGDDGQLLVLGQPPADTWRETVSDWFRNHFAGRTHRVATCIAAATPTGQPATAIVQTRVTFTADVEPWLQWYLDTGEPRDKAGGYGLQSAGSLFVDHIDGSPSNVIGLPLRETAALLKSVVTSKS